jgi:segregation and condensation protein B
MTLLAPIQALLFIHGEPLSIAAIAEALKASEEDVQAAVASLADMLQKDDQGLTLLIHGSRVQLVTKPAFGALLEQFARAEFDTELTPAALETLSLIAYLGPLKRSVIEYHRGVNSALTLRNLSLRGLIEKEGSSDDPAYRASAELLRHMGIDRIESLPEYTDLRERLLQKPTADTITS